MQWIAWLKTVKLAIPKKPSESPHHKKAISLNVRSWRFFRYEDIFEIKKGRCSNASGLLEDGDEINYVGAKKTSNGVVKRVKHVDGLVSDGNCIVFIGDGQGSVGYSLYQPKEFIGSTTLICGYNSNLTANNAIFLVTLLDLERFKYSFGRKYNMTSIQNAKIKLPVDSQGNPDWQFMEDYIKSLPYSSNL